MSGARRPKNAPAETFMKVSVSGPDLTKIILGMKMAQELCASQLAMSSRLADRTAGQTRMQLLRLSVHFKNTLGEFQSIEQLLMRAASLEVALRPDLPSPPTQSERKATR